MGFFRFFAFLLLVGLLAVVGVNIYNAGVSAGIAADVGNAIASGAPVPAGYYHGPYVAQPWGFGLGGFFIGFLILFVFFGLLRTAFGGRRWDGHHRGGYPKSGRRDYLDEWHRERHAEAPADPAPDKA